MSAQTSHAMKVVERIFEHRIRQQIEIDDMQFGFMKGKGTCDAIFMARQMQENFRVKGKKLYFGFVDLEKAFDRVPREVISRAMRKLGVEEWLVSAVMSMYSGAKTVVSTVYGNSKSFEVIVGMHQGSALSPLLFVIFMEAISREFRVALPWELLYADDIALVLQQKRLHWYGHVLRKDDDDWVKKCMEYEVDASRPRGRPKRTWKEVVREDCQARKLNKEDAVDHCKWRKMIKEVR